MTRHLKWRRLSNFLYEAHGSVKRTEDTRSLLRSNSKRNKGKYQCNSNHYNKIYVHFNDVWHQFWKRKCKTYIIRILQEKNSVISCSCIRFLYSQYKVFFYVLVLIFHLFIQLFILCSGTYISTSTYRKEHLNNTKNCM